MQLYDCASVFGRHEFLIRRLHSLTGLIPIGGYLAFHLATNAAILDGLPAYQHRADQIHRLGPTTILFLEWSVIFLPILFHGIVGLLIVGRGRRNLAQYPYTGNFRYTLQRATGVIAMAFILWHVFQMHGWFRGDWWVESIARPLGGARFDATAAMTAPAVIQSSWVYVVLYAIGTLASVYHLANGLWTMGITWGVWTSPRAQRMANIPCAVFGVLLAVVGLGALYGMYTTDLTAVPAGGEIPAHSRAGFDPGHESLLGASKLNGERRI
ncbi:MAG: succinate dehydrogenase/fumarate reductase transmembrane subunit [Thermoguttaceae bacterium]